jgi:acetyl esterase/lipase
MKRYVASVLFVVMFMAGFAQKIEYITKLNISYYSDSVNQSDQYIRERCLLDIYCPVNRKKFPTVVWFHGGGLTSGDKEIPVGLKEQGICIVSVNYRLYPKVKCPKYIEDAATAVAWVFNNIENYGGDTKLIFVSGHSAGAYLTSMVGLDKRWLSVNKIDANKIAGLIPISGNGITHQAIRNEKGISQMIPIVDEYAPLFHVRADAPPLILMTGDRELEYIGRYEENAYLMRMMKLVGHKETILYEFGGYDHMIVTPAFPMLFLQVKRITERIKNSQK